MTASTASGKFQIRTYPDLHEAAAEFARLSNLSLNKFVENAILFSLDRKGDFLKFSDDYDFGSLMTVKNGMPDIHLVRRNFISYRNTDENTVEIAFKRLDTVRREWVIDRTTVKIDENPTMLKKFDMWLRSNYTILRSNCEN